MPLSAPPVSRTPSRLGLVGRAVELAVVEGAFVPGGAALVLGGKGTGKSALLGAARRAAVARGFSAALVHVSEQTDVTVRKVLVSLGAGGARLPRLGARALEALLLRWCSEHRSALLLDDAECGNAGFLRVVRHLVIETPAAVLVAARTGPADPPDRLRKALLAGSREVHLGPLPAAAARALASAHVGTDGALAAEIARASGRIPAAIVEMARRRRDPRYRFGGKISWAVLLSELRVENRI